MRNGKSGTGYMELNTINKTGTWSETADRINSNFSKISIEVEEIKQNGGGGGGDVTNADHATSAYTLDKNTPVLDWFLSALNDDDAQGIINYLKGLKIAGNLINRIVKQGDKDVTYTDEDVMSALRVMTEIENSAEKLKEIFVRKDVADSTKFLLSMFAGAVFGKNGFASGLTGFGAKIFDTGHGEFESMFIRRFLEVPELRYNRVMVTLGDKWRAPGAGIIETVDTGTKTCTLKLEDGEIGAVAVGDICMGIYHNITGNATEDYDDGKGNRRFAGFCTVYFTITEVTGERNETFKYQLRPTSSSWSSSFDPFEMMTFVAYGSFTNTERQTSVYETRTYTRMLWKQNTWEISAANVALQYGDLSNLNIFELLPTASNEKKGLMPAGGVSRIPSFRYSSDNVYKLEYPFYGIVGGHSDRANTTSLYVMEVDRIYKIYATSGNTISFKKDSDGNVYASGGDGGFKFYIIPFNGRTVEVYSGDISNFEQISVL